MRVYGDRGRVVDPRDALARLGAEVAAAGALPSGLARHAALVAGLIACGELAQGLADAAFEAAGADAPDPAADLALRATRDLADAVVRSWRAGAVGSAVEATALAGLAALPLPEAITVKEGEGYAFYSLYPEAYAEAARLLEARPDAVLGLRSIGTSLGAVVAAALDAPVFATLRPTGDPFRRQVRVSSVLAERLLAPKTGRVAVVDEGPGLSGSSFGAALDWAEAAGVPRERLIAFPSHAGGLGPEASAPHRARWAAIGKPFISFDQAILPRLAAWVADLTGPSAEPLQDLSGGAWRALRCAAKADWPPAHTVQERRKFLLHSGQGAFLLRFAGLGQAGVRKLARARALATAGLTPQPLGLRHGFLVEPWVTPSREPIARPALLDALRRNLAFRAERLPAGDDDGADATALFAMLRFNACEAFGADVVADALSLWRERLPAIGERVRPVVTDNRLHRWEWLGDGEGAVLKADALDHAEAHDLVGCQDIAWDVAGATVELDLSPEEQAGLLRAVDAAGRISPEFLRFHQLAYLAFQLGAADMAAKAHGGWPEEAARLARERARYEKGLRRMLSA